MQKAIFLICLLLAGNVLAETSTDVSLAASRDDNVSRAVRSADIEDDNIVGLGVHLQRAWLVNAASGILLKGGVEFDQYQHFSGLSHLIANASTSYRIQPVAGYSAPLFDISAALERYVFPGSDIRDGTALLGDISVSSRVTDRIRLSGGLGVESRWADQDNVYEWHHRRIHVGGDYKYSAMVNLYASLSRIDGDQVVTSSPDPGLFNESKAIVSDPAFGARRAYRIDATSYGLELGGNIALSANTALDIGVRRFAIVTGDDEYDSNELHVSWLYRFK